MTENSPTPEEWRRLYEAAVRVKELAPWQWMWEDEIFGVQHPETGELGFVSVMGRGGEHYAVALYLGPKGLYDFWDLQATAGEEADPEQLLETPQLQASFEDRKELRKQDHEVIKQLGLKFRGAHAWPLFRSFRPGFFPWFMTAEEARFLTYALEQVPDVALRLRDDPSLLPSPEKEEYLLRTPRQTEGATVWEDQVRRVPPPEPVTIQVAMDLKALADLRSRPRSNHVLELDFFMVPTPFQEKGARPAFPYMLLLGEAQSGLILGTELLQPDPSLEAMWGLIPVKVVHQLSPLGVVPREVRVRSELLFHLLQELAADLGFELKQTDTLRGLDQAKEFLLQRFL